MWPDVRQVLGDANPGLVAAYQAAQGSERGGVHPRFADVDYWRSLRDEDLPKLSLEERATRFAVCLHTAWGTRWGTNREGAFCPGGTPVNKGWCAPDYLSRKLSSFYEGAWVTSRDSVFCADWVDTARRATAGSLVYLDPPYPEREGYGNQVWTLENLLDRVDWCNDNKSFVSIVVSNMATVRRLFERIGFQTRIIPAGKPTRTRLPREEVLAWHFL